MIFNLLLISILSIKSTNAIGTIIPKTQISANNIIPDQQINLRASPEKQNIERVNLCKKGFFSSCFSASQQLSLEELKDIAFLTPTKKTSSNVLKKYTDELIASGKTKEAENISKMFQSALTFEKIKDFSKLAPFDPKIIKAIKDHTELLKSSSEFPGQAKDNFKLFLKDWEKSKLKYISENPMKHYNGQTLIINDKKIILDEKLGEGTYGITYSGSLEGKAVVVKFTKADYMKQKQVYENEVHALKTTKMFIGSNDEFKVTIQEFIPGKPLDKILVDLQNKITDNPNDINSLQKLNEYIKQYKELPKTFMDSYGLAHGDPAPRNVIVSGNEMRYIDFGNTVPLSSSKVSKEDILRDELFIADSELKLTMGFQKFKEAMETPNAKESEEIIFDYLDIVKKLGRHDDYDAYLRQYWINKD